MLVLCFMLYVVVCWLCVCWLFMCWLLVVDCLSMIVIVVCWLFVCWLFVVDLEFATVIPIVPVGVVVVVIERVSVVVFCLFVVVC